MRTSWLAGFQCNRWRPASKPSGERSEDARPHAPGRHALSGHSSAGEYKYRQALIGRGAAFRRLVSPVFSGWREKGFPHGPRSGGWRPLRGSSGLFSGVIMFSPTRIVKAGYLLGLAIVVALLVRPNPSQGQYRINPPIPGFTSGNTVGLPPAPMIP